jgi:hydrogenase large subunit
VAIARNGLVSPLDLSKIQEHVAYSWYIGRAGSQNPSTGFTEPKYPKDSAYSWLKAPRYAGAAHECGPLARMWVNGDYRHGVSVMDRHRARALETLKVAQAMRTWLDQLSGTTVYKSCTIPANASGIGLTEAPRGAIGHWMQSSAGKLTRYQIVTPTCWNASPRDAGGSRGPLEQALIGTPITDAAKPLEVMRVIHSYDPCLSCAVHVMRPDEDVSVYALGHHSAPGGPTPEPVITR